MKFMTDMTVKNLPQYMQMAEKQKQNNIAQEQAQAKQEQVAKIDTLGRKFLAMGDYSAEGIQKFAQTENVSTTVMKELVGVIKPFMEAQKADKAAKATAQYRADTLKGQQEGRDATLKASQQGTMDKISAFNVQNEEKIGAAKIAAAAKLKQDEIDNKISQGNLDFKRKGSVETYTDENGIQHTRTTGEQIGETNSKSTINRQQKAQDEIAAQFSQLDGVKTDVKKRDFNIPYRGLSMIKNIAARFGKELSADEIKERSRHIGVKSNSINRSNEYVHAMSGAVMNKDEVKRYMSAIPKFGNGIFDGDSYTDFMTKMKKNEEWLRKAQARLSYARKNGYKSMDDVSLENMGKIMKETGEKYYTESLESDPDMSKPEREAHVRKQLATYFGVYF